MKKILIFSMCAFIATANLSAPVHAMGMLVAMGAPFSQNIVERVAVHAEKHAATIEPAAGRSACSAAETHETRKYNQ